MKSNSHIIGFSATLILTGVHQLLLPADSGAMKAQVLTPIFTVDVEVAFDIADDIVAQHRVAGREVSPLPVGRHFRRFRQRLCGEVREAHPELVFHDRILIGGGSGRHPIP